MISVAARTAYPPTTPAPRVRIGGFVDRVADGGIDLRYMPTLTDEEYAAVVSHASPARKARVLGAAGVRAACAKPQADLTLIHRLLFLAPIPGIDPPRRLDVYDFDDALHLGSISSSNRRLAPLKREAARWRTYAGRARTVIAGSSHLADVARAERSGPIEVVPSCVEPGNYELRVHGDVEELTLGWIGSRSTAPYLDEVIEVVAGIRSKGTPVRLVVVGAEIERQEPWLRCRPWSLEREAADLASFDVGLMPMPDNDWARGKCGYKLLQYFSAGVPAIATPVGVASAVVGSDRGFLASSPEEWVTAISELAASAATRAEMGANARAFVERDYSYERWAPELVRLITDLA